MKMTFDIIYAASCTFRRVLIPIQKRDRKFLLNLSDNNRKQVQFNTVFVQQEEMDRVGLFEPTTSASQQLLLCHGESFLLSDLICPYIHEILTLWIVRTKV
jgi:hypothetical protein